VDGQHRQLFAAYYDLLESLQQGKSRDEVSKTVEFLTGYVAMHFDMEEGLQRESGYPDYPRHKRIHNEFKETVADLMRRFRREGPTEDFIASVTALVGDWLFNHVRGDDFRMAAFVKSQPRRERRDAHSRKLKGAASVTMLKYLIFDLDNTLYSCRHGLEKNVERRLKKFTAAFLGLSPEEAWKQRAAARNKYGTCLEWLMAEKGFTDIDAYLAAAHPEGEADTLPRDDDLREFLSGIKLPKAILTNAPKEHADLILDKLGVTDLFTHIFDIRQCGFVGKPHRKVFDNALSVLGISVQEALFIDDIPSYAEGFADMGGKALLFDENNVHNGCRAAKIRDLREIVKYIGRDA